MVLSPGLGRNPAQNMPSSGAPFSVFESRTSAIRDQARAPLLKLFETLVLLSGMLTAENYKALAVFLWNCCFEVSGGAYIRQVLNIHHFVPAR